METLDPTIVALAKAIKYSETGTGDTYTQKGASGEFGAYQFMPATYANYASKYLGSSVAKATKENQNRIVYSFIKSKKEQGFNPSQIASMWNAGEKKPDAYKQNWVGVNSQGVKYDTPGYVKKVSAYYQQFKPALQSQSTYEEPPVTSAFTSDNPVVEEKSFIRKVADFFTSGTQAFGKDIGEALASGKNADLYSQAMDNYTQVQNNLQLEINKRLKTGQDATKLISTLQDFKSKPPKLEDFTGDTINKTTKQILGDAGMTVLEATSGGLLSGGKGVIANSGKLIKETIPLIDKTLTTGQKILQGGKIGAIYGGLSGGTGAMQQNKSTGNIVLDSFVSSALGFGLGAGLTAVGVGISKGIGKTRAILNPTEKAFTNAETNVARAYEKTLNLTPSQRAKEQALLNNTGDNVYTTLVKNHINLGSKEADTQLTNVLNLYEKGIEQAQKNEHGLFNLNEVVQNSFKEIDLKLPSATARETAKNKIRKEVLLMLKDHEGTIIKNTEKQTLVDSSFMERLRKTGNSWTPFNASDPEKIGKSTGYALANAVRDNVEKYGTFTEYRNAMREWGKVIHVQQVLGKLEKSGKAQFRVLGGLSGAISRRILSGALGYHTGGLGGLILGELGGEYGARVMSNPTLRTYLDRLIINNYDKKITPEVVTKLANQIEKEIAKQDKLLKLPAKTETKATLITPAPTTYEKPAEKIMNQSIKVDKAPITKQTSINPSKANISKSITPLEVEAKKYKSAEEFVNSMIYHGTDKPFDTFDFSKVGTGGTGNAHGTGAYFTSSPEIAKDYASGYGNVNAILNKTEGKLNGKVLMSSKPSGELLDFRKFAEAPKTLDFYKQGLKKMEDAGFTGVTKDTNVLQQLKRADLGKESFEQVLSKLEMEISNNSQYASKLNDAFGINDYFLPKDKFAGLIDNSASYPRPKATNVSGAKDIVLFDKGQPIKTYPAMTKSQLTDIWNKAHIKK